MQSLDPARLEPKAGMVEFSSLRNLLHTVQKFFYPTHPYLPRVILWKDIA